MFSCGCVYTYACEGLLHIKRDILKLSTRIAYLHKRGNVLVLMMVVIAPYQYVLIYYYIVDLRTSKTSYAI